MPSFDRVSVGFPGVVRQGRILTAPHFVTVKGPGSNISPELARAWKGYQAADVLGARLGRAVRIANDADMQGMAVVEGGGLELVVTLGTGVGTAVFLDGQLESHVELAHHPFRKGQTYNEQLGDATLQQIGPAKWRRRVVARSPISRSSSTTTAATSAGAMPGAPWATSIRRSSSSTTWPASSVG